MSPSLDPNSLDRLSKESLLRFNSGIAPKDDTCLLPAIDEAGLVAICPTDWSSSRGTTRQLGVYGKWDPLLAYLAYYFHLKGREGPFKALHLGSGDGRLLRDLTVRRTKICEALSDIKRHSSITIQKPDESAQFLEEYVGDLWEQYGLANKIYIEIATILSIILPTPSDAEDNIKNSFKDLRRYLGLLILYRAQIATPLGEKCAEALKSKTGIFDIILHPDQYGFKSDLAPYPIPGEYDISGSETPSRALEDIWIEYFTGPFKFLQKFHISTTAPSLRAILAQSASHHGLILGEFTTTTISQGCADLITSLRGDSHVSDDDFIKMLENKILPALNEDGVFWTDGIVHSYDEFECGRMLGLVRATIRGKIYKTGLVLRPSARDAAVARVQAAFVTRLSDGSSPLDFCPILEEGTIIVDPLEYMHSISFAVRQAIENIIRLTADQRKTSPQEITRNRHPALNNIHADLVRKFAQEQPDLSRIFSHCLLPIDDDRLFKDLERIGHPIHDFVCGLVDQLLILPI